MSLEHKYCDRAELSLLIHLEVTWFQALRAANVWMVLVQKATKMRGAIRLRIRQITAHLAHAMAASLMTLLYVPGVR
jgi:hypothetical protein